MTRSSAPQPGTPDGLAADEWVLAERRSDVRFELPTMRVHDTTLVYEDEALARRVREATGVDQSTRFFFATALSFDPPLPPLTGVPSTLPTVLREGRRAFADELSDRGVRDVERGRTERTRTADRNRLTLTSYRGRLPVRPTGSGDGEAGRDDDRRGGDDRRTGDDRAGDERAGDEPVDRRDVPVAGYLGVWVRDGSFRMAGGGYPDRSLSEVLPGGPETDARAFRDELLSLIRHTR